MGNTNFILLTFPQNDKFRFHCLNRYLSRYLLSDVPKCPCLGGIGLADDNRHALIATLPHLDAQRNRSQKGNAVRLGKLLAAPFAEDVIASARVGSDEVTHILNYSEHRYGNGLKHSQSPAYVGDSHVLRRGYQHCALYRY